MPKATVAQRQRMTDSLEENMVYMCVFVSSVRDAWYKLTASCEDAALRRNKYTFAAALFVLQNITVLGRLLGSLRRMARLPKSFCKRHKQIYTNAALGRCYTYTYSHTWLLYDIIADIGSVDRVLHKKWDLACCMVPLLTQQVSYGGGALGFPHTQTFMMSQLSQQV